MQVCACPAEIPLCCAANGLMNAWSGRSLDTEENLRNAEALVREAHARGAQIILLQELFAGLYFCQV